MHLVRGSALIGFEALVSRYGGDARSILADVGIDPPDAGNAERLISLRSAIMAVECAATNLNIDDFGRQLALAQDMNILGPVSVAARTAKTVEEALAIFDEHMDDYSNGICAQVLPGNSRATYRFDYDFVLRPAPPKVQSLELALGLTLRVLRAFLGSQYRPIGVHFRHAATGSTSGYHRYFGCPPHFADSFTGFTIRSEDLARPLQHDPLAHKLALDYLAITAKSANPQNDDADAVRSMVRQLLPEGGVTAETVARRFSVHPKTLRRRLAAHGTTFAEVIDHTRSDLARQLLVGTDLPIGQVARQLGYAEPSVFTRACRRWFAAPPSEARKILRCAQPSAAFRATVSRS